MSWFDMRGSWSYDCDRDETGEPFKIKS